MWKVSIAILLGFLVLSFNYVWVNRHQFTPQGGGIVIVNKWTGRTCVLGATADVHSYWYSLYVLGELVGVNGDNLGA